ncbi:MAG: acetate/propionate family kinase, partial [Deferribacterales bacterium]|nr:acetate/propionate family kinase [Deferribacterales bacterium]
VPQVAIFDTAFYQTMPEYAYMYAIPRKWYDRYHVRRYGFHGTSHLYVSRRASVMLGKPWNECNIISLHIGNGVSITAIENGIAVDTSMGFTPLEGAIMGTRSGDIDPAIPLFMQQAAGLNADEVSVILNRRSGVLGITGKYTDRRDVIRLANDGDRYCKLALEMEHYHLKKYIGMYYAVLGHVDALVFTAGVGENSPHAREMSVAGLEHIGISMDKEKNKNILSSSGETDLTAEGGEVKIFMIPTNEELVFIEDVVGILSGEYTDPLTYKYTFSN